MIIRENALSENKVKPKICALNSGELEVTILKEMFHSLFIQSL